MPSVVALVSPGSGLGGVGSGKLQHSECDPVPSSKKQLNACPRQPNACLRLCANRSPLFGVSFANRSAYRGSTRVEGFSRRSVVGQGVFLGGFSPVLSSGSVGESEDAQSYDSKQNDKVEEEEYFPPPTRITTTGRVVAVGDLHGDLLQTMRVLQLAGVMATPVPGEPARWIGGDTIFVQMGDILDRGDSEIGILRMLWQLGEGAREAGGAVYILNGNHETLNVSGDFRYVTPGAFKESAMVALGTSDFGNAGVSFTMQARARLALFSPGAPLARRLAQNPTILIVNDTVFAHGGLLPSHAQYGIERINEEVSQWMLGGTEPPEIAIFTPDSVVWNRLYSRDLTDERFYACEVLRQALDMVGAKRLVVGHTPQVQGCNEECEGMVWRIDVGMSSGVMGAPVQALEIVPRDPALSPVSTLDAGEEEEEDYADGYWNILSDAAANGTENGTPAAYSGKPSNFPDVQISILSFN